MVQEIQTIQDPLIQEIKNTKFYGSSNFVSFPKIRLPTKRGAIAKGLLNGLQETNENQERGGHYEPHSIESRIKISRSMLRYNQKFRYNSKTAHAVFVKAKIQNCKKRQQVLNALDVPDQSDSLTTKIKNLHLKKIEAKNDFAKKCIDLLVSIEPRVSNYCGVLIDHKREFLKEE